MTTLDCNDIKAILSGLVDGEVDHNTRHAAERHLADCKPCRGLVNETERLNDLVVQDAKMMFESGVLPAGFEEVVLRKTVYAEAYQFAGRSWTSWLGWVAAAACLLLATAIWTLDRQRGSFLPRGENNIGLLPVPPAPGSRGYLTDRLAKSSVLDDNVFISPWTNDSEPSEGVVRLVDYQLAAYQPMPYSDAPLVQNRSALLSEHDSDAIQAASRLLAMLDQADLKSFKDVEYIRQIAIYDEVLERLADARGRLSAEDRPAVLAAESVLLRLVNGPLSLEDVRLLRETNASLNLPAQMDAMSNRSDTATSL